MNSKKQNKIDKKIKDVEQKIIIKDDLNDAPPKPLVARISLWTTRTGAVTPRADCRDSGNDSDDDSGDDNADFELDENAQLEQRLKQADLPDFVRKVAEKELARLKRTPSFMSDFSLTRNYLELITELPWNESTNEIIDLKKSRRDLNNDHYGMQKLKERVLQYLAVRKLKQHATSKSAQPILLFVGPPGTGKTSIAQSIANSLGRKFQRISLGGVADQSAIRGHRRTYVASMPGRIIQGIRQAGVNNPVFLLDEVDKLSPGSQGDPSGALLEVLDPEQNHTFTDHFLNLPFDLSKVLFIATANTLQTIPDPLLDRMEIIQISGYTHDEKFNIARQHLIPKQVIDNGLKSNMIVFKDDAIHKIIANYAREAGVRTLERRLATICRMVAVQIVESQTSGTETSFGQPAATAVIVDADSIESYLGPVVYDKEAINRATVPGVATGLAWTVSGGEITFVEAEILQGSRKEGLILTGLLGSVMRESAMLALNWIRANFHRYVSLPASLGQDLIENTVHIHFPAGAVTKDGPSAGVTIVVALMSMCSNLSVVPDLAMTGEITLRGVVLKVGGVKSKVLAAHRAGIKQVILPNKNESDLDDIPINVRDKMKFHFVSTVDEVIRIAFDNALVLKKNFQPTISMDASGLTSKL